MRFVPHAGALVTLALLTGCSSFSQPAPQTKYVTVTRGPVEPASTLQARRGDSGQPQVSVVMAGDRCAADAGRTEAGSIRITLLNLGSKFADLALRTSDGGAEDIYRLPNVGPDATGEMTVRLEAGTYSLVCSADRDDIGRPVTLLVE